MNKESKKDWESEIKEFEMETDLGTVYHPAIKSFIRDKIASAVEAREREISEAVEKKGKLDEIQREKISHNYRERESLIDDVEENIFENIRSFINPSKESV